MILLSNDYRSVLMADGKLSNKSPILARNLSSTMNLLHKNLLFPDHSKFIQASSCVSF